MITISKVRKESLARNGRRHRFVLKVGHYKFYMTMKETKRLQDRLFDLIVDDEYTHHANGRKIQ